MVQTPPASRQESCAGGLFDRDFVYACGKRGHKMKPAGYNSPQRMTQKDRLAFFLLALLFATPVWATNSWDTPSAELAKQIAAVTGPGTVSLAIGNRSSIPVDDIPTIRKGLERELRSAGVVVQTRSSNTEIRLTFSQNAKGWLWVAEIQEGAEHKVVIVEVPAIAKGTRSVPGQQMALQRTVLLRQGNPILDVAFIELSGQRHMVVLEPEQIKLYVPDASGWQMKQSFEIVHTKPFPRDVRGRIGPGSDRAFTAHLPGVACAATKPVETTPVAVSCVDSDDPWPLVTHKAFFNSARNYFTGVLSPGVVANLPQFYSAAELDQNGTAALLLVDLAGQVHLFESGTYRNVIGARDWGSDMAITSSECGAGTQVLASAAGWPGADSLRAYELKGHELAPVTPALTFEGAITALWQSNDQVSATVVVQNPQESQYEAYRVTISCNR